MGRLVLLVEACCTRMIRVRMTGIRIRVGNRIRVGCQGRAQSCTRGPVRLQAKGYGRADNLHLKASARHRQVIDLAGMSPINMLQYVRREDAQTDWQHNMDFCPETLNKARARRPGVQGLARTSAESCLCCRGGFYG